jgi:tetratricopeptide (TPR) repeat protein
VLEAVLAREPRSLEAVRGLAANALDEGDATHALECHLRLQELGDRTPEVLHNTGLLRQRTGDLAGAVESYAAAIAARPDFAEALLNQGHALHALGREAEARAAWAKALELKPEFAQGYFLTA